MYSPCPRCATRLTVTAALLRQTRGAFCCDHCGEHFDGLATVSEDTPAAEVESFEHELAAIAATLAREAQPALQKMHEAPPATAEELGHPEFPAFETIDETHDPFDIPVEHDPGPILLTEQRLGGGAHPTAPRAAVRGRDALIVAALGVVLLGQLIGGLPDIGVSIPALGPWLSHVTEALGQHLELRPDPTTFEVQRATRAPTEAAGQLTLHARIINHATRAQPLPLLRVTLDDAAGTPVAQRAFLPSEYLANHTAPPPATMAPDERLEVTLTLVDPGAQAVGFTLDACIRQESELRCGPDPRPVSPAP